MKKSLIIGSVVAALAFATPALAHHSAAQFDFTKPTTVEGIVKIYEVNNPHSKLVLEVTDTKGTREITFEGHSRNNVYRQGWRPDLVKVGDHIKIRIAPTRNGEDGGYVVGVTTDDGHTY